MRPAPEEVVAAARRWIGTPYHHQAALRGAGCDCLGLIRGVWRDLYGAEPEAPPPYTPDWGETGTGEPMLEAARRHLVEIDARAAGPGDVILFRLRPGAIVKHAAVLSGGGRMIHAVSRDRVREEAVGAWWTRRAVAGFGWPERSPPLPPGGGPGRIAGAGGSAGSDPPAPVGSDAIVRHPLDPFGCRITPYKEAIPRTIVATSDVAESNTERSSVRSS